MTIIEMQAKRAAAAQKLKDLHTAASTRAFTEDEQRSWDATKAEIADWDARIARQAEIDAEDERQRAAGLAAQPPVAGGAGAESIEVVRDLAAERPFETFGDFLRAVAQSSIPGGSVDRRLYSRTERAVTGQGEGIGSDGGFLPQQNHVEGIIRNAYDASQIAQRCRRIPLSGNENSIKLKAVDETSRATGSRWGGVVVYWTAEADTVTAGKVKFRTMQLTLDKLMGLWYVTDELLMDVAALGAVGQQAFTEEIAWMLDDAIINGNGSGRPLGIMSSGSLVTVSKEGSQANDTVLQANVSKMWARSWVRGRNNAVWLTNQDVEPQFDTLNTPIKNVAGTENVGGITQLVYNADKNTLKNRPIVVVEQCKTLGDLGDLILADLSQYLIIEKGGAEMAQSMHVRFIYGENTFRFTYRVNGMPLWTNALTPANGSNTTSPFVTLQAR